MHDVWFLLAVVGGLFVVFMLGFHFGHASGWDGCMKYIDKRPRM